MTKTYAELRDERVADKCGGVECPQGQCSCRGWAYQRSPEGIAEEARLNTPPMTHRVFVYGTLKRGLWNNRLLIGSHFAGLAQTPAMFRMIEPSFPVILEQHGGRPVAGELWHVDDDTLASLDRLEGVNEDGSGMYFRKVIDVVEAGHVVGAYIYVGNPLRWDHPRSGIPSYNKMNTAGALDWKP